LIVSDNEVDFVRSKVRDHVHVQIHIVQWGEGQYVCCKRLRRDKERKKARRGRVRLGEEDKRPPQRDVNEVSGGY
jgi:hypothetical protein